MDNMDILKTARVRDVAVYGGYRDSDNRMLIQVCFWC